MGVAINGTSGVIFNDNSTQNTAATGFGFKNRIINGAMMIDQRNAGAAVLNSSNFVVDRWADFKAGSGQYTAQQSTIAPSGFVNSFQHTVTTASSPAAGDVYQIVQSIEGFNTADFGFGTASASSVAVSFWVRSSVAGLYAIALQNSGQSRSYVATYSISSVNTFEYKTITIPGDVAGTWLTNNGVGVILIFDLGSGSNQNTTAGAWQAGQFRRTSACVNWINNAGATFYITGVQLEKGSTATSFDYRPYGTELALCERYYQKLGTVGYANVGVGLQSNSRTGMYAYVKPSVDMRTSPTAGFSSLIVTDRETFETDVTGINGISASGNSIFISMAKVASGTALYPVFLTVKGTTSGYLELMAEL